MKEGDFYRFPGGGHGAGVAHRRGQKMHYGFGDAKVEQANPHTRRKQHGEPGTKAEVRLGMVRPQFDVAVTGQAEKDHADHDQRDSSDIKPAGIDG